MYKKEIVPTHAKLISSILGKNTPPPMNAWEMASHLKVTFYPPHSHSPKLQRFSQSLKEVLTQLGVQVIPYAQALNPSKPGKVRPGIVIIEQGQGRSEDMAIHRVSSLHNNPLVALYDAPPPIQQDNSNQALLDAIVGVLAWNLTHIPIFINKGNWTFCTMNGAVIQCSLKEAFAKDVLYQLIPKLAAQVIPPKRDQFVIREYDFNSTAGSHHSFIDDMIKSSQIWKANGLMLGHTAVDSLKFRGRRYQRIVRAYLDGRSGMSYGFLVRQLPTPIWPAKQRSAHQAFFTQIEWDPNGLGQLDGRTYAQIQLLNECWIVPIPDVWVMGTRSGCDKTNIDPNKDIILTGLSNGKIILKIPKGLTNSAVRPSYDTVAILAHAVGNAVAASLLKAIHKNSPFSVALSQHGLTISHWHGYLPKNKSPLGYIAHGSKNLPVSCSTPQSAIYAFCGKMAGLQKAIVQQTDYQGDIHIEPHHGTNMVGTMSLQATAAWIDKTCMAGHCLQLLKNDALPEPPLPEALDTHALAS